MSSKAFFLDIIFLVLLSNPYIYYTNCRESRPRAIKESLQIIFEDESLERPFQFNKVQINQSEGSNEEIWNPVRLTNQFPVKPPEINTLEENEVPVNIPNRVGVLGTSFPNGTSILQQLELFDILTPDEFSNLLDETPVGTLKVLKKISAANPKAGHRFLLRLAQIFKNNKNNGKLDYHTWPNPSGGQGVSETRSNSTPQRTSTGKIRFPSDNEEAIDAGPNITSSVIPENHPHPIRPETLFSQEKLKLRLRNIMSIVKAHLSTTPTPVPFPESAIPPARAAHYRPQPQIFRPAKADPSSIKFRNYQFKVMDPPPVQINPELYQYSFNYPEPSYPESQRQFSFVPSNGRQHVSTFYNRNGLPQPQSQSLAPTYQIFELPPSSSGNKEIYGSQGNPISSNSFQVLPNPGLFPQGQGHPASQNPFQVSWSIQQVPEGSSSSTSQSQTIVDDTNSLSHEIAQQIIAAMEQNEEPPRTLTQIQPMTSSFNIPKGYFNPRPPAPVRTVLNSYELGKLYSPGLSVSPPQGQGQVQSSILTRPQLSSQVDPYVGGLETNNLVSTTFPNPNQSLNELIGKTSSVINEVSNNIKVSSPGITSSDTSATVTSYDPQAMTRKVLEFSIGFLAFLAFGSYIAATLFQAIVPNIRFYIPGTNTTSMLGVLFGKSLQDDPWRSPMSLIDPSPVLGQILVDGFIGGRASILEGLERLVLKALTEAPERSLE